MKDFEKEFFITGPAGQIQAYGHNADPEGPFVGQKKIAIICHPHPQHGGTMDNKVVTTLMRCYRDLGAYVVRFNFRGVGKSEGHFAQAKGEYQDLMAVIEYLTKDFPDYRLLLAGFSFGSSIAAQASYHIPQLDNLCLVAPPVERYEYDQNAAFIVPLCVIQGDKDERVIAQGVYDWCSSLKSPVHLIRYPDATHFFHGYLTQIKTDLSAYLSLQLASLENH